MSNVTPGPSFCMGPHSWVLRFQWGRYFYFCPSCGASAAAEVSP